MQTIKILACLLLAFLLAGCAAQRAFDNGQSLLEEGKLDEGLTQIEKAHKLDPDNAEFRSQYFKLREVVVYQWLSMAEAAKNNSDWEEAAKSYNHVLKVDPANPRARIGLSTLNTEKKQAQLLSEAKAQLESNDLAGASHKVRTVLAESPSNPGALKLQQKIEAAASMNSPADASLKSKLARPITIEFKDSPVQTVFDYISKVSGINFIMDKEVRPDLRTNLFVRDSRIEDVIRFVLVSNQLEQRSLNGNTLFIYPNTPQKLKDFQELQVKNFYLTNASAKDVSAVIKGIVKTKDIFVDEKANLIVMRDTPDAIRVAERLVAAQDVAEPEVVLEVEILEVGTSTLDAIGIQYPSQLSFSVVGAAGTPGSLTLPEIHNRNSGLVRAAITDPALIINLLHQDGDTNLLANPKIRVKNHEKANVHIGDKVPVITSTTTSTGFVSQSVNYLDVGLKLDVEPTVYLDNDVGIKVGLEVSSITKQIQQASGSLTYQIGTRNASTVLRLKDNETQMLAGLIDKEDRKTANGVPILGQLPLVGRLFSSHSDTASKTEVVLLITPHVVRNVIRTDAPVEEFPSGTESAISLKRLDIRQEREDKGGQGTPVPKDMSGQVSPQANSVPSALPLTAAKLSFDAPAQIAAGKEFTLKINLAAQDLQNAMLELAYDPTKLKVVNVLEGDLLKKPDGKTQFLQQVQDKTGHVNFSVIRQGNVQGEGLLASVTFQALGNEAGKTQVNVGSVNLSDAVGRVLAVDTLPLAIVEITK
ncbi:MAG TPA: secretin N-terminal domain-containing protein [Gallionellaceae bacterium]